MFLFRRDFDPEAGPVLRSVSVALSGLLLTGTEVRFKGTDLAIGAGGKSVRGRKLPWLPERQFGRRYQHECVMSLFRFESFTRGAVYSSGFNLFAAFLSFLAGVTIAFFFGTDVRTDLYFFCVATVMMISAVIVSSLNVAVVIPESISLAIRKGETVSMEFLNVFLYLYIAAGSAIALLCLIDPTAIVLWVAKFSPSDVVANSSILVGSLVLLVLMLPVLHMTDILVSRRLFTLPAMSSACNSVAVILTVILSHARFGVGSAILGMVLGYGLQCIALVVVMKSALGWNFRIKSVHLERRILNNLVATEGAYAASYVANYIPSPLLTGFGPGTLSAYGYAQRVVNLPSTFVLNAVMKVVAVKFNEHTAKDDWEGLNKSLYAIGRMLVFLLIPFSVFVGVFSREIIIVLFQRGAFSEQSVALSVGFLVWFAVLPPLIALNGSFSQILIAAKRVRALSLLQIASNCFLMLLMVVMLHYIGSQATIIAVAATYLGLIVVWPLMIHRYAPEIRVRALVLTFIKMVALQAPVIPMLLVVQALFKPQGTWVTLAAGAAVYGIVLTIIAHFLHFHRDVKNAMQKLFSDGTPG